MALMATFNKKHDRQEEMKKGCDALLQKSTNGSTRVMKSTHHLLGKRKAERVEEEEVIYLSSDLDEEEGGSDDDSDAPDDDDDDDDDDDYLDTETDDASIDSTSTSDSEGPSNVKARKTMQAGNFRFGGAEPGQQREKNKYKQMLGKKSGHARNGLTQGEEDQNHYAEALNIISGGDVEKLKLEHCKAYLRHYSLRLTGSKTVLLERIQEHLELKDGGGMARFPKSSFTINCTGDACTGDIVLFKQKIYENYNIASRSSVLPPLGKRVVAGRIVKESYGSQKQQHTFTVEVLWSKGPKALPLLYPLIIKGRNLYRLKTFRQRWPNEEDRKRVLGEKHSRGSVARNTRIDRLAGKKKHSCPSKKRQARHEADAGLKRKGRDRIKVSRVDETAIEATCTRGKAPSRNGTMPMQGKMKTNAVFSQSFKAAPAKSMLSIKACLAGAVIGRHGKNIAAITRVSGAKLQVCEDPLDPTLRIVEILGSPEQAQVAKELVVQSLVNKGLPPPQLHPTSSSTVRHVMV